MAKCNSFEAGRTPTISKLLCNSFLSSEVACKEGQLVAYIIFCISGFFRVYYIRMIQIRIIMDDHFDHGCMNRSDESLTRVDSSIAFTIMHYDPSTVILDNNILLSIVTLVIPNECTLNYLKLLLMYTLLMYI